ncbi:hypothetical protein [Nitrosospira multiformis]|uniref:Uncharacterized protein n=1 Tax=Nitrosospira multiformis TaxID=1231 RepID=A0A1I7GB21_9PROT|nr:hypothetical protein [Nitrosospira multiformis]SFU45650.1 hypothetical protein SAMN05216417_10474 [Nitrosospira multiformis]
MAKLGDELEKHIDESDPLFLKNVSDCSPLLDHGCITVAQCAMIPSGMLLRGEVRRQHFDVIDHYLALAFLDIGKGRLNPKHPLTHIPYSEYLRMMKAGMFGADGADCPTPNGYWLISLDQAERWLQSKGIHFDFTQLRAEAGSGRYESEADLASRVEAMPAPSSSVYDWQSQARLIADEYFDADTRMRCRDSLKGYSNRVTEEMQKRGIKGPRGFIDNPNTVMREALQGEKWWGNKQK